MDEVHDVLEEFKEEEFELQVLEDMPFVDEDISTLNGNDDDKEDTPMNMSWNELNVISSSSIQQIFIDDGLSVASKIKVNNFI
ncbi:unnamed protein product [Lactuca saligna]|uniref:Uncharacterized protein n=1 Tax=Lactuca saligna TaxID=75948 RepID=A0AA35YZI4_LACSI|nr:unnamed protein product [Lactuca saligna]